MVQYVFNQVRVQFLGNRIVRLEQSLKGAFCDENTYFVPDRTQFPDTATATVKTSEKGNIICFGNNYELTIPLDADSLKGVTLRQDGKVVYRYVKKYNCGELPPVVNTPQVYAVYDRPRVIMPKQGYCVGAKYVVQNNVNDVYLILCENNHKLLRKLYVELTGRTEMVRLSTLGFWNSRYFAHSEQSAKELLLEYVKRDIPLDNMVLDTDWRKASDRGIGYEIDDVLFPDMKAFYKFAHSQGVEIMFNDHPEPVEGAKSVFDRKEIKYREKNLKQHLKMGLDYWWYDRNWHTKLISPTTKIHPESFGSYIFADITKQYFQSKEGNVYRRPIIMSNVDNISNGNYIGINDSASHRYSMQWTGDITSDESSIAVEIKNMLRAENSCITYVNSDCGGHTGNPTKQEFIRWMQFGAFSPIFRPHCTKGVTRFREPWAYDDETLNITRQYVNLRYRLLPVIYKNAYESYLYGQPLFKPLVYENIGDKKTYKIDDEYTLGDNILIAPLHGTAPRKVGAECYCDKVYAKYFDGIDHQGDVLASATYDKLDMYLNHVSPEKNVPVYNFSAIFETSVRFKKDVELIVDADDGVTVEVDGVVTLEDKTFHSATKMKAGVLTAGEVHRLKIYYYQGGGEAALSLYYNETDSPYNLDSRKVYLPQGDWIDLFTGKEYKGGKSYARKYDLHEMPLFARKGAAVPLIENKQTTKLQNWSNITFDFFPSKETIVHDYLYEDDKQTTAYKQGEIRVSEFSTAYDSKHNSMILTVYPANDKLNDGLSRRKITVKYHLLDGLNQVTAVLVNDRPIKFTEVKRNSAAFPLTTDLCACDCPILVVSFEQDIHDQTVVQFCLK